MDPEAGAQAVHRAARHRGRISEAIQDMPSWFEIQPLLANGDTSAPTSWSSATAGAHQAHRTGYLAPLKRDQLTNCRVRRRVLHDVGLRLRQPVHRPYASGITGIAYDPERVGREITHQGPVGPRVQGTDRHDAHPQEISNFALLYNGVARKTPPRGLEAAAEVLKKQRRRDLPPTSRTTSSRSPTATSGSPWPGPVTSTRSTPRRHQPQVRYPEEGATLWTDNLIPIGKLIDALMLIDFFYDRTSPPSLTEYINYICRCRTRRSTVDRRGTRRRGQRSPRAGEQPVFLRAFTPDSTTVVLDVEAGEDEEFNSIFQAVTHA